MTKDKVDWIAIRTEYTTVEGTSYEKLGKKYGVCDSTIKARGRRENWKELRQINLAEINKKTSEIVKDSIVNTKATINVRHSETAEKLEDLINSMLVQFKKELLEVGAGGRKKTRATPVNIDLLASALKKVQDVQRLANNITVEQEEALEPEIKIIENLDFEKI